MKNSKIIFVIFSLLFINLACSQVSPLTQVKASDLSILDNENNQVSFFGTKEELVQNFGQPILKNVLTNADMIDYESETYAYTGIKLTVENRPENSIFISFRITNSNYYIKYNNTSIKIDDKIDDFKNLFSKSFDFMENTEKKNWLRIEFNYLDTVFIPYSCGLFLNWDENTRQINKIEIHSF